jgi:hypothetical protein
MATKTSETTVTGATRTRTGATAAGSTTLSVSTGSGFHPSLLAFAKCMRASGVSDFPDPKPGAGGFDIPGDIESSPAFNTAQAKCQKLMPNPLAGFQTNPSAKTMERLRQIAVCMRAHGVPQFPDPLATRPTNLPIQPPGKYQEITDFDGATLLFPRSIDLQAPAYRKALTACGAPPLGLAH